MRVGGDWFAGQMIRAAARAALKMLWDWGAGIRTPIGRSRVGSPTVERHPNVVSEGYDTLTLKPCQAVCCSLLVFYDFDRV